MKNTIIVAVSLLGAINLQASLTVSWSSTMSSSASNIEAAQRWLSQLEQSERTYATFTSEEPEYLQTSGLSARATLLIEEDRFHFTYLTLIEQPTDITLNSFDKEGILSFSRTIGVIPITTSGRSGTTRYLYAEEFLLTQEELFPFVDQPLELLALYENFDAVSMEANISAIPEPNSALFFGISALFLIAYQTKPVR